MKRRYTLLLICEHLDDTLAHTRTHTQASKARRWATCEEERVEATAASLHQIPKSANTRKQAHMTISRNTYQVVAKCSHKRSIEKQAKKKKKGANNRWNQVQAPAQHRISIHAPSLPTGRYSIAPSTVGVSQIVFLFFFYFLLLRQHNERQKKTDNRTPQQQQKKT